MPLPYSYKFKYDKQIYSKQLFTKNLKKQLKEAKNFSVFKNTITFQLNKALIPFNYDVKIEFIDNQTITYEVSLTNLALINLIVILLFLFVIKNLINLMIFSIILFVITYAINIFHINVYLNHYLDLANQKPKQKCPNCSTWIDEDFDYCPNCGYPLRTTTTAQINFKYVLKNQKNGHSKS